MPNRGSSIFRIAILSSAKAESFPQKRIYRKYRENSERIQREYWRIQDNEKSWMEILRKENPGKILGKNPKILKILGTHFLRKKGKKRVQDTH
jgi:hypothetical protein